MTEPTDLLDESRQAAQRAVHRTGNMARVFVFVFLAMAALGAALDVNETFWLGIGGAMLYTVLFWVCRWRELVFMERVRRGEL